MSHDVLDDRAILERLDPHGRLARIEAWPERCGAAWRRARGRGTGSLQDAGKFRVGSCRSPPLGKTICKAALPGEEA